MDAMLLICGLGYCGRAVAAAALAAGWRVSGTTRSPNTPVPAGVIPVAFDAAGPMIARATHLLVTAPPDAASDPLLARHGDAIATAQRLCWSGYLSTTGVYGDRAGGWVDEATLAAPGCDRTRRRLAAEQAWLAVADRLAVDIFRCAGIYGPGRSAFDDLRAGHARRVEKPGHAFGRIHRDDLVAAILAAMRQDRAAGGRILNLADDEPAESEAVIAEAARLLGMAPPPAIPFAQAWAAMSPMARSFWAENRKVSAQKTQTMLGLRWRYPSYREGLCAILAEEGVKNPP